MGPAKLLAAAATLAVMTSGAASASSLVYSLTGSYEATFTIDDSAQAYVDPGFPGIFFIYDVPGTFGGREGLAGFTFYSDAAGGGLTLTFQIPGTDDFEFANPTNGVQLFDGDITSPTLLAFGPITFADYFDAEKSYTLSATMLTAVPEVQTWLMLVAGFGLAGAALRSRKTVVAFA